jgi:TonB-dependent SusC/RagA subfamily outer membrane receptor
MAAWQDLEVAGADRYCKSCEKHIVDLTTKSDTDLIQFFKNKKDNVCGRLLSSQLNRELVLPPAKINWHWLLLLAVGAIVVSPVQASELRPVIVEFTLLKTSTELAVKQPVAVDTINGRVVDVQTGEPLKGVKVRQKGFENVLALTDSAGKFELDLSEENIATEFTFELNGYAKVEAQPNNGMVVKLSVVRTIMLGGISAMPLNKEPLYLVYSGKKSCTIDASRMKELPSDWIEKLDILKDAKATALYGSKAANGVILIGIKKAYAKKIDFSKNK